MLFPFISINQKSNGTQLLKEENMSLKNYEKYVQHWQNQEQKLT